jgi:hypothetical protein
MEIDGTYMERANTMGDLTERSGIRANSIMSGERLHKSGRRDLSTNQEDLHTWSRPELVQCPTRKSQQTHDERRGDTNRSVGICFYGKHVTILLFLF